MQTRVEGLMQVGGWYWQTDRIELYASGTLKDTLFHANDNVLKMYHNNTEFENTVIWKSENGPAIQPGWLPRDLQNVHVKDTYIIHNKTGLKLENYTVGGPRISKWNVIWRAAALGRLNFDGDLWDRSNVW